MTNIVSIRKINGNIFQEIEYSNFSELQYKLELMIKSYDSDILYQLLIDNEFLNDIHRISMSILSKLNENNYILIVLNDKKTMYCLGKEENGKYIKDYTRSDNYSELLTVIIKNSNNSYDIIMNNSYKNLVLLALRVDIHILMYISIDLKNDEEIMLIAIKKSKFGLKYASTDLQNNKEFVLKAVKYHGLALGFAEDAFKNDKEIVLEAVKQNKLSLFSASIDLKNDEDVILAAK